MISISGLLFAFLRFTTANFPVRTQRVPGFFLLVGEILGLGLVCSVVSMKTVIMVWRVVTVLILEE